MGRLPNYDPAEHTPRLSDLAMTRREVLQRTGMGMGAMSLAMMLRESLFGANAAEAAALKQSSALSPRKPHFTGKAKRVIHIFAGGGPSHVDTFDPKPVLAKYED